MQNEITCDTIYCEYVYPNESIFDNWVFYNILYFYVKRVIAGPKDTVLIEDGICYVNGKKSEYVTEKIKEAGIAEVEFTLESGEFFCMGDNVNNSEDSRSANIGNDGMVDTRYILGHAIFRIFPISKIGNIDE